jgi:hypothetical protein
LRDIVKVKSQIRFSGFGKLDGSVEVVGLGKMLETV